MSLEKSLGKNGWFPITRKIGWDTRDKFQKYVEVTDKELKLILCTSGGDILEALHIVDLIKLWKEVEKGTVRAFCLGECSSAGLTILSACDKEHRESSLHTKFLFHSAFIQTRTRHNLGLEANQEALKRQWNWMEMALKQECDGFGISKEKNMELRRLGENHSYNLSATDMYELGMISKICNAPSVI